MRRNRWIPALAVLALLTSYAGAAELTPEGRDRVRRVRYALRETPAPAEAAVPLKNVVRGYALILERQVAGSSEESRYWRRAAKGFVRLAVTIGNHLHDLDPRVAPAPLPIEIRTRLRRVAARLRALTAGGNGDAGYWRATATQLLGILHEQAQELYAVQDMIHGGAPDRVLPAHLSLYYLGVTLGAVAPTGSGDEGYWRRCAEDQVSLTRGMGLAVANYVRFMQQPVRRLLLEEAAALRGVKLGDVTGLEGWYREAHRLGAVLESHRQVLFLISEELR